MKFFFRQKRSNFLEKSRFISSSEIGYSKYLRKDFDAFYVFVKNTLWKKLN